MKKQQVNYAERQACKYFDDWLEVTGVVPLNSSYHSEMESLITDAVHIGIQMALYGKLSKDENGELVKQN